MCVFVGKGGSGGQKSRRKGLTTYRIYNINRRISCTSDPPCLPCLGFPFATVPEEPLIVLAGVSGARPVCMPEPVGVALNSALF